MSETKDPLKDFRAQLHWPARANCLDDAENHLFMATGLARSLWLAAQSETAFNEDRDAEAFRQLASALADHVSAAQLAFHLKWQKREMAK